MEETRRKVMIGVGAVVTVLLVLVAYCASVHLSDLHYSNLRDSSTQVPASGVSQVRGTASKSSFVGTWIYHSSNAGDLVMEIRSDGTGVLGQESLNWQSDGAGGFKFELRERKPGTTNGYYTGRYSGKTIGETQLLLNTNEEISQLVFERAK